MWMQTVNKDDVEKVWLNFTNSEGATISAHYPVAKFLYTAAKSLSVRANEVACTPTVYGYAGAGPGSFVGLSIEDVPDNDTGIAQAYGYHESVLLYTTDGDTTIRPGFPLGLHPTCVSLGMNSAGTAVGQAGPVVALNTIGASLLSITAAGGATAFADDVFLRAL